MSSYPGPVILGFGTSTRRRPAKFTEPAHLDKRRPLKLLRFREELAKCLFGRGEARKVQPGKVSLQYL